MGKDLGFWYVKKGQVKDVRREEMIWDYYDEISHLLHPLLLGKLKVKVNKFPHFRLTEHREEGKLGSSLEESGSVFLHRKRKFFNSSRAGRVSAHLRK